MLSRRMFNQVAVLSAAAVGGPSLAQSKTYPSAPIRWVNPFAAGGAVDVVSRKLAEAVSAELGQPIIVDNRTGAGGSIGTLSVARAVPDGYSFVIAIPDSLINVEAVIKNPGYDARKDLTLVTQFAAASPVMLVNSNLGVKSLAELVAAAKSRPGQISYGSWGAATLAHLVMSTIEQNSTAKFNHIPYRGAAPALQDLAAKQIHIAFAPWHLVKQYQQQGWAEPIAVVGPERIKQLPEIATFAEQGFGNSITAARIWIALAGPKNLPSEIVQTMFGAIQKVSHSPKFETEIEAMSHIPLATSPKEFSQTFSHEYKATLSLIRSLGVQPA